LLQNNLHDYIQQISTIVRGSGVEEEPRDTMWHFKMLLSSYYAVWQLTTIVCKIVVYVWDSDSTGTCFAGRTSWLQSHSSNVRGKTKQPKIILSTSKVFTQFCRMLYRRTRSPSWNNVGYTDLHCLFSETLTPDELIVAEITVLSHPKSSSSSLRQYHRSIDHMWLPV